jgi:indole-3-glycerol phosphate synthase / phosphoribosylanthranilate isomerase
MFMNFLQKIRPQKESEVEQLATMFARTAPERPSGLPVRNFSTALQGGDRLIAEIKGKSPSHPEFHQPAKPPTLAAAYFRNGAAALSIVTDAIHFGTSLSDVAGVKAAVPLPVLVKDFVIDEVQLLAAWAAGADAVLLIVRMLDGDRLAQLLQYALSLGLHPLVECHDQADIERALKAGARLIGVNNRNLATLSTDLSHGAALLPGIPENVVRISESGLYGRSDILRMSGLGADAFLVGHALLKSRDPGRKVAELCGQESEVAVRVKTCGITNVADAVMAHNAGAHILGLIFAPGVRQVSRDEARSIRQALPDSRLCGVFVDEDPARIVDLVSACDLDLLQLHGEESPAYCRNLSATLGLPLIKALTADVATPRMAARYDTAAYFLVDLPKGSEKRGQTPDHCQTAARKLSAAGHDVFLAGGLLPTNVRKACSGFQPFAVDVASGVESEPGSKDPDKTQTFILEATR